MADATVPLRYLCIHGHFYQPPRENPWLEAIEVQDSASPYHDWNERVTAECYAPNTAARILDADHRIAKIVNNYASISFNFGPTLLAWMQHHAPEAYREILAADRASAQRFSGHGSALAQCYNHIIMPLANARDKRTQVRWGIEDFRHRFGREPEGMWLPETAVDLETLAILAENGIKYTILAPSQAASVDGEDASGEQIDPTRAYRQNLPGGRSISIFFYDGPVARSVAFEKLLSNGERFASRLLDIFSAERTEPQLAHIATDGETYGHHHAHGDMALAYALEQIQSNGLTKLTNYGEFLELHPPAHEVEILENTAWSCIHGVGRWSLNCGCNSGGRPAWNQEWRAALRQALDWLRDEIATRYEATAAGYLKDPWAARDDYIHVILDRSAESQDRFAARHLRRKHVQRADRIKVWKLLELQRNAMLMYTSCGWFFDELSGLETVQIMQYAGRVVQLAEELFGESLEPRFLERLAEAKSNIPEHRDGARIYERFVRPARVDLHKLAAHYALSSVFFAHEDIDRVYCYSVESKDYRLKRSGKMRLAFGKARFTSEITQESELLMTGVIQSGDHNLHGGVGTFPGDEAYHRLARTVREAFVHPDLPEAIRRLEQAFQGHTYSLKDMFRDEQRRIVDQLIESKREEAAASYGRIYESNAPLLRFMSECYIPIPKDLKAAAEVALTGLLRTALEASELNLSLLRTLFDDVRAAGVTLDTAALEKILRRNLEQDCESFFDAPRDLESLSKCRASMEAATSLPLPLVLWSIQNRCYALLETVYPEMQDRGDTEWAAEFERLATLLALRV